jgi:SAM-dependent methyltransferase
VEKEYYKVYYDLERNHWWFTAREKIILKQIDLLFSSGRFQKGNVKILNIGCGTGRSSEYLSAFGDVTSVEYDQFCCSFTREKTGLDILHGSITALDFQDESFDLVCAFDVIEHVEDDVPAVEEMKRVSKKGGAIVITVPAFMIHWSHHDEVNHHFRRYRLHQIRSLFCKNPNGKELFASYFNFWLFMPILIARKVSVHLKWLIRRKGAGSDFETFKPGMTNNLLHHLMDSENLFLGRKIPLPFGVSIIFSWLKNK